MGRGIYKWSATHAYPPNKTREREREIKTKYKTKERDRKNNTYLDGGIDLDRGNNTDDIRRSMEVDKTLVDSHLETVPGVGTFTTRRLADGETESLGGHTDGSMVLEVLLLGLGDKVGAD